MAGEVSGSQRFLHPAEALEDFQTLVRVQLDSLPWSEAGDEKAVQPAGIGEGRNPPVVCAGEVAGAVQHLLQHTVEVRAQVWTGVRCPWGTRTPAGGAARRHRPTRRTSDPGQKTLAALRTTSGSDRGACRNPLPDGIHAGLQQAQAPGPELPAGMRSDITDRVPPCGRAFTRRSPQTTYICCPGTARAQ